MVNPMPRSLGGPTKAQSKRDRLVEAALRLFEREGYRATGIDRILEEAGVAKMTLYNHFRSKDELILAALRLRDERSRDWLARRVAELGKTPRERLLAVFDAAREWYVSDSFNGCLFARACCEFAEEDHPVRAAAREHVRLLGRDLASLAREAGAPDPEGLAESLMLLHVGATTSAQINSCATSAERARRTAETVVDRALSGR